MGKRMYGIRSFAFRIPHPHAAAASRLRLPRIWNPSFRIDEYNFISVTMQADILEIQEYVFNVMSTTACYGPVCFCHIVHLQKSSRSSSPAAWLSSYIHRSYPFKWLPGGDLSRLCLVLDSAQINNVYFLIPSWCRPIVSFTYVFYFTQMLVTLQCLHNCIMQHC